MLCLLIGKDESFEVAFRSLAREYCVCVCVCVCVWLVCQQWYDVQSTAPGGLVMHHVRNVLRNLSADGRSESFSQPADTSRYRPDCQKNRWAPLFAETQRVVDCRVQSEGGSVILSELVSA